MLQLVPTSAPDTTGALPPETEAQYLGIIGAKLPTLRNAHLRQEYRTERAKQIRSLLRSLGIKCVSVTTPNYSMASSIDIRMPIVKGAQHEIGRTSWGELDWDSHDAQTCYTCQIRKAAKEKLTAIILAAFPDLADRSDYQTDYFDYCFSID